MKFEKEKQKAIITYILEKISSGEKDRLTEKIAETLGLNRNTVHSYINKLVDEGIIRRVKRGIYETVKNEYIYKLSREEGKLSSDMGAYRECLKPHTEDLPPNVRLIWEYGFSEMINNVMDHSMADSAEVTVIRDYQHISVIISDNGIGIFEKIRSYFDYATLEDAICELFKGKLTTDSENHSGEGIFFTSKIMDAFFIISDGRIFSNNKYEESEILKLANTDTRGTTVYLELSNNSRKNLRDVFDMYSNVDGGFTKTLIPLKNIFESSPVSRSQAKRICNRLESFREVTLDFEGMEWMGQGFAHQLFVVFKNSHPGIEITPVNMCEAVEAMYKHVRKTAGP